MHAEKEKEPTKTNGALEKSTIKEFIFLLFLLAFYSKANYSRHVYPKILISF